MSDQMKMLDSMQAYNMFLYAAGFLFIALMGTIIWMTIKMDNKSVEDLSRKPLEED